MPVIDPVAVTEIKYLINWNILFHVHDQMVINDFHALDRSKT